MPRPKKIKAEETKEAPEIPVENTNPEAVASEESEAKKAFRAYMESYKVKNPAKYALKEKEFIKHLETL